MADLTDLERRIRVLEDVDAIKEIKSEYWYCIDKKLWDGLADCFTEDGILEYVPSSLKLQGGKEIGQNLAGTLGPLITVHQGQNARIEITSDTTAKGTWAFCDIIVDDQAKTESKGWGFYEDEYAKEEGKWKIKSTRITRLFSEMRKRGDF